MNIAEEFKPLFYPEAVAVVGASEDQQKYGRYCVQGLIDSKFPGPIYPINPRSPTILGLQAYPSLKDVPGKVDLAVIVLPNSLIPEVLLDCANKGVRGVVIISAGFKEIDDRKAGIELEGRIAHLANEAGIKIIGPNTFGMINTHANLDASFTPYLARLRKGPIALLSQSGGICHFLIPWLMNEGETIGFSKVVGLGNRANVEFADMIEYLSQDTETELIAMYIEGLDNPRRLMETAKKVKGKKPMVAYKVGRSKIVDQASLSHTGSLAGRYELYSAAFRQAGIISAYSLMELFDVSKALAIQTPPRGKNVAVASPIAGPVVIGADICESNGLKLAKFSPERQDEINRLIPPIVIRTNPVDLTYTAWDVNVYLEVAKIILEDKNIDALIFNYGYHDGYPPLPSKELIKLSQIYRKPIIVAIGVPMPIWGEKIVELQAHGIPVYPTPERACQALLGLVKYGEALGWY